MKKKTSFQLIYFCSPLLVAVFFACSLLQTSCNNAGGQTKEPQSAQQKSNHWITMDITFKPNTNAEFREKAIKAIEKMWMKAAAPLSKEYANFHPSVTVIKTPSDTLKYRLSLLNTFYAKNSSGEPKMLKINPPPCNPPCPGPCPGCDSTNGSTSSAYKIAKMTFEVPK